jgi:uncharacterized cupredoxin-like copper-binding protein
LNGAASGGSAISRIMGGVQPTGLPTLAVHPARPLALLATLVLVVAACGSGAPAMTPPITPGTSASPREVNIVARDYAYVPPIVDLVPGETVVLHVINGGLEIHEAILGDLDSQLAWETAEAATVGAPPGPTPFVPPPAGFTGTRIVVGSGQRVDVTWTVPTDATQAAGGWFVGCHIPGHWAKGMVVPVRFVDAGGRPLASPGSASGVPSPAPSTSPGG